jgi:ribosomal protein S12 methylthiotransferase accessory factor
MSRSYHSLQDLATALKVTRVARVTGLDRTGVEVACAVRPDGQILQVCNGKGWTWEQAYASAVFETAELVAAETYRHLWRTERDVDGERQWSSARFGGVAGRLIPTAMIDLLNHDQMVTVPAHAIACSRGIPGPVTVSWSSNGMGAGVSHKQALAHALDEVWERHALAVTLPDGWEVGRVALRRIPIKFPSLTENGFDVAVFDLSLDEGPYVIGVLLFDREEGPVPLAAGYCARSDFKMAIDGALLEAAQSRLTEIHAAREDVVTKPGPREVRAFAGEILELLPLDFEPKRSFGDWWKGRDVAFASMSPVNGVWVVKVLAPGLQVSELL